MNVFLSASFPSGKRGKKFKPYDTAAISAAVRALTRAILLAEHRIVFGAHPMISPVVLLAAGEFEVSGAIDVFQSEYFRKDIPSETWRLVELGYGEMRMIPQDSSGERDRSLALMRKAMFTAQPLAAGIFVGGMEGIHDEYNLLKKHQPRAARLPLTAPGGAARDLKPGDDPISQELKGILGDEHYPVVAHEIVSVLDRAGGDEDRADRSRPV
jgi:hypothetical protein